MFRSHAGSNRAIVLLIDGESDSFAPAFAAGIAAGGRMLHVLSSDPSSIIQYSRFCSRFHHYDSGDVVGEIRKIRAAENVEVIVACSDTGIRFLAQHRAELVELAAVMGTSGAESLAIARDKARFAEYLATTDLPSPTTAVIRDGCFDRNQLPPFPALLKPAFGIAGSGIRYLDSLSRLEALAAVPGFSETPWIVQSFIPGTDIDVSVLCRDGRILAHTVQVAFAPNAETFTPNYSIRMVHDDPALQVARELVRALEWTGLAHIDLRRDARDGRVFILELNGRFWASAYGSLAAGLNFPELAVRDAKRESFPYPVYSDRNWVQLSLARRINWASVSLRDLQVVRHLKDPGPLLACRMRRGRRGTAEENFGRTSELVRT